MWGTVVVVRVDIRVPVEVTAEPEHEGVMCRSTNVSMELPTKGMQGRD